jgi:phage host-nuclease inhibitor protein Gam
MANEVQKTARAPKALWEVSKLLSRLAGNMFAEMRMKHSYKVKITKLEQERDAKAAEKKTARDVIVNQIFEFVSVRKESLSSAKSVSFAMGQVGFRKMAPAVEIATGFTEKQVLAKLLKRGKKYLRFTPKLNKEKILQDWNDGAFRNVSGITIRQGEEFFISLAPRGKEKPETITVSV